MFKRVVGALLAAAVLFSATPAGVLMTFAAGANAALLNSSSINPAKTAAANAQSLLVPVPGSGCVVDDADGLIYGLAQGITSLDGYASVLDGYILEYLPTGNGFGTGTVVNILKNSVVEGTYIIVIFGDVNGDGSIDSIDAGTIVDYENYLKLWDPVTDAAYLKAGDINGDNSRDSLDAGLIVDLENYLIGLDQTNGMSYSSTIAFDSAGGSAVLPLYGNTGEELAAPANPVKTGYTFAGWLPVLPAVFTGGRLSVTAQWTLNYYSITFNANGGSGGTVLSLPYGSIPTPPSVSKTGYNFSGWSPDVAAVTQQALYTAQWTANTYTIIYNANGGTGTTANSTHTYDVAKNLTTNGFLKTGHSFLGWSTNPGATGKDYDNGQSVLNLSANQSDVITFYAVWKVNKYYITFDSTGGSAVATIGQNYGTAVTPPVPPTRAGYTFAGWLPAVPAIMPAGGAACVAQWTVNQYTVTFDSAGGSAVAAITQNYGSSVNPPASPVKTGYTFAGWIPVVPALMPVGGAACVAQWTVNQYTVTFDSAGGSSVAPITQNYGSAIIPPAEPVKTGYSFTGWLPAVPAVMPANGLTCVAQWTVQGCTITFDDNGGMGGEVQTIAYGQIPTAPIVTKEGYAFDKWSPDIQAVTGDATYTAQWTAILYFANFYVDSVLYDANGYYFGDDLVIPPNPEKDGFLFAGWDRAIPAVMPAEDLTFNAQWTAVTTISFEASGGSPVAPVTGAVGTAVIPPENPVKTGYTFNGWQPAIPATFPAEDITVFALWQANDYTVTFDDNGGTGGEVQTVAYAEIPTAPIVTKEGHSFEGWSPDITAVTGDATYTAQWTPVNYSITWDANGGSGGLIASAAYGTTPTAPNVTKTGFSFAHWSPSVAPVTGDAVYTAQWTIKQYTVTFDSAGGSAVAAITQNYDTAVIAPVPPTKTGYTFTGWLPSVPATMPATATACVAQWTINQYTVTFDSAGGSAVAAITLNYGTVITSPAPPVKTGYTFAGWLPAVPATMPAGGATCVAQWTINQYTVTFDSAGGSAVTAITQNYGTVITVPAPPTKTGYTFAGWLPAVPATMPATATTCVAQWTINQFTVTFDTAGGSAVAAITQNYGTVITSPAPPVKTGYTFAGWLPAVPATMPAENINCVAQWTINQYTITFDSAGGSAVAAITQNYDTAVIAPVPPTKTGYTFTGWLPAVPATMPATATTCIAQWEIIHYTIIFDTDGGTGGTTTSVAHGSTPTPPAVAKAGYTFTGWDQTITAATANKTYTAQWLINQYIITFDSAGGSDVPAITQDYGTTVITPAAPDRIGYTFIGWLPAVPAAMPAGDMTCVAQWAINQRTIDFD